jgi:hypothetical protein
MLETLQRSAVRYFWELANPENGLVPDSTCRGAPSSIAATGFGLACLTVAAERSWISREDAAKRACTTLRTFWRGPAGGEPAAIGHRGFFYHFLDMKTGHRAKKCELSTIDTTFLLAGGLVAGAYFDGPDPVETEIRDLSRALYRRVDWQWALAEGSAVSHGWKPERGFLKARWQGYNEALLLYALALGSPTFPIPESSYRSWTHTYRWKKIYDWELLYAGPLFTHQFSHAWIDFRDIPDAYMRARGIDYFENSRRATLIQQRYAILNPRGFRGYGEHCWGLSSGDGPGPRVRTVDGRERRFWDYRARGVPWGPDDGTLTPWAVAASLPFEPELVLRTLTGMERQVPGTRGELDYRYSFNLTFPPDGWVSGRNYGVDHGPVSLMIENFRTGMIWDLTRRCTPVVDGLRRAGFGGGWLGPHESLAPVREGI